MKAQVLREWLRWLCECLAQEPRKRVGAEKFSDIADGAAYNGLAHCEQATSAHERVQRNKCEAVFDEIVRIWEEDESAIFSKSLAIKAARLYLNRKRTPKGFLWAAREVCLYCRWCGSVIPGERRKTLPLTLSCIECAKVH